MTKLFKSLYYINKSVAEYYKCVAINNASSLRLCVHSVLHTIILLYYIWA